MTAAPRRTARWQRRVQAAFTERLALKGAAVLLAVVLWFVVGARAPTEDVAGVRFAPVLDSALVLRDPPSPIRALVIGRPSEILKLVNTPLVIRRPIMSDAPDTLVLALRTSDVLVPEGVSVIVRDVQPRSLTLRFESTATRRVPVRSAIVVGAPDGAPDGAAGAPAGAPEVTVRLEPSHVTVFGPRRAVTQLQFVPTVAEGIPVDNFSHLVDLDTAGLGVTVRPTQVKASFVRAGAPPR